LDSPRDCDVIIYMWLLLGNKVFRLLAVALLACPACFARGASPLMEQGWQALVRDNDTQAMQYFGDAYIAAVKENDTLGKAEALLYMGICSYGASYTIGLDYCVKAMAEYKKLEHPRAALAFEGRSRCLLLVATIKCRQGHYAEAIQLSREAMGGFTEHDTTGSLGLIYGVLGAAHYQLGRADSAEYYHRMALAQHLRTGYMAYIPNAYAEVAAIEMRNGHKEESRALYDRALRISDSMDNRQGIALTKLGLGEWSLAFGNNVHDAEAYYRDAGSIAATLTDRTFSMKVYQHMYDLHHAQGNYKQAIIYKDSLSTVRDSMYSWDKRREIKSMEIQFDVAEKDRQLELVRKENEIARLMNYMLWGGIVITLLVSGAVITMLRRINRRDKQLLQAKEALVEAMNEQKRLEEEQRILKEKQMQQELEFKESQLSAMTLQMLQKNELMQELKDRIEEDKVSSKDPVLNKIINKGMSQDKEWTDFNIYFESINQHFYTRLKQAYPDISPNDLKICALIKLRLSIKEMASILNISPDSVKTARYRLRKRLGMNTEDNLTDFIEGL